MIEIKFNLKGDKMKLFLIFLFMAVSSACAAYAQDENNTPEEKDSLAIGMTAPDFTLQDASGNEFTLSSYKDKSPVVVYFYPKANTSGCTKQACGIRDSWSKFEKNNIKVLGISTDTKEEIESFVENYHLNFPLLSDADKTVSRAYNVLKESGTDKRVTFVIDKEGIIRDIIEVNDIENHADKVFALAVELK